MADSFVIISGGIKNGDNKKLTGNKSSPFLVFDSVPTQNINLTCRPSQYAVEGGDSISDNVATNNDNFSMTGIVSNSYVEYHQNNQFQYSGKRTQIAVDLLRKIKEAREPLTIATEFEVWDNCILTGVSYSLTAQTVEAIPFELTFEKLRIVSPKYVTLSIKDIRDSKADGNSTSTSSSAKGGDAKKDAQSTTDGGSSNAKKSYVEQLNQSRQDNKQWTLPSGPWNPNLK